MDTQRDTSGSVEVVMRNGQQLFEARGSVAHVQHFFDEYLQRMSRGAPQVSGGDFSPDKAPAMLGGGTPAGSRASNDSREVGPLPVFLSEREHLKTNPEIATAIVYWAAARGDEEGLTSADVERHWKQTRLKAPSNLSRDLSNAVKNGWLEKEGRVFRATGYGKATIDGMQDG